MIEKELRKYIIKGFVWTVIILAVVEFILVSMIMNGILPMMAEQFFPQIMTVRSIDDFFELPRITKNIVLITITASGVISVFPLAGGALIFSGRVTRKLKAYEALREKEREDEQKQRYLMISDIAHDLKTPMTTVTGYAKALSDGMVKKEQESEYLNAIKDKTLRMNDIVQMLFDYVRLDSNGFGLSITKTDVCELVREAVASYYQDIEEAGDEVEVDIPDKPSYINCDKVQLARVISNILTNAVKHNPRGTKLAVKMKCEPDEVRVLFADGGDPIEPELAKDIFEPFVMGDKSRSTGGGSGLGLSVAHKIMSLHGFKIKLVQKPEMQRYQLGDGYNKVFIMIMESLEG